MVRQTPTERGVTLLEILVVLLVVALLAGALTVGYGRLPPTAMKREATRIAAALRTAYDPAAAAGQHHRLVIDLGEGPFFLARCEGPIELRRSRDLPEE